MTRPQMHVEPQAVQTTDEWVTLSADISGHPFRRHRNGRLHFSVPTDQAAALPVQGDGDDCHDYLARALVMSAMEGDCDLVIHGQVTTELLANLETYQRVIANCWPEYQLIDLTADVERTVYRPPAEAASDDAVLAFSGGMDSIHSLYGHYHQLRGRNNRRIRQCVFVHGFDIDEEDPSYNVAFRRAAPIVESLGARLIPVRTNLKRLLPYWLNAYPSAVAGVLSLFSRRYPTGVFASSVEYRLPLPFADGCASYAPCDALLSATEFRVLPDYADESRVEKARVLLDCEVARRLLRVCWAGVDKGRNCGVCDKCVRQMLAMRAWGIEDLSAFDASLEADRVRAVDSGMLYVRFELQACLEVAATRGLAQRPEFVALREALDAGEQKLVDEGTARLIASYRPGNREAKPRIVRWAERLAGRAR